MPLRDIALTDLSEIMNDPDTGGPLCSITSPAGASETFHVFHSDIHLLVDPGTGQMVTGRQAHVSVLIPELIAVGFAGIEGVADSNAKPWVVDIADATGRAWKFKVASTEPDYGHGLMTLTLEVYQ